MDDRFANNYKPIESSNLKEAAYCILTQKLFVRFRNGTEYRYENVNPHLWNSFEKTFDGKNGNSAGRFFQKHIRQLPSEKIEG